MTEKAAYFITQHAPAETLRNMTRKIKTLTNLKVHLVKDSQKNNPGNVYITLGDRHLCINSKPLSISLNQVPKENYVRPLADPLLRFAVITFLKSTLGIVLTGLGVDETQGAVRIEAVGDEIFAQDPKSTVAPLISNNIILSGLSTAVVKLDEINSKIEAQVSKLVQT